MKFSLCLLLVYSASVFGNYTTFLRANLEDRRIDMIVEIISLNLKKNGWNTILCFGDLPDAFYNKINYIPFAFLVTTLNDTDDDIDFDAEDLIPHHSNIIVINCLNFDHYEESLLKIINSPYWHPLANIIIYYHTKEEREIIGKIFFSLWYHKAVNSIIVQYDDQQETLLITNYNPYVDENYDLPLDDRLGCWTTRKVGMPVLGFTDGLVCVEECHNVSLYTKLRANNLGTCTGVNTTVVSYNALKDLRDLNLFEDKSKNLHGFKLRAYTTEVEPFLIITEHENGTYTIHGRDGILWNTLSKLMNFGVDLTPSLSVMKEQFNFELNIEQIFAFARRRGDLYLIPIYLFDVIVVDIDFMFPHMGSGVCIMSTRAGFETTIFDIKTLKVHFELIVKFIVCFICIWITFSAYKAFENGRLTLDQLGKDLMNALRNILLISLYKPPKRESFRIFLAVSLWSFFVINFTSQATIISLFTAVKRGKEVETFEDIIEKGYVIEGMASPDLILPDSEEKYRIINSRLVPEQDLFGCVKRLSNDSRRFCLIDCAVGRYLVRNKLNEKGEQYLHIATDRMHSHYLSIILSKHSPLSERVNKYMMTFFEAGLVRKWEQYRYTDIKDDVSIKALGIDELNGIFKVYCYSVGFTCIIFLLEIISYYGKKTIRICMKCRKYK